MSFGPVKVGNEGLEKLKAGLDEVEREMTHGGLRKPLQIALQLTAKEIQANVLKGGNPMYPDVTAKTRRKRRVDPQAPPLVDSGSMLRAATATTEGVPDALYNLTDNTGTIGVERADVNAHVYGTRRTLVSGKLGGEPPRPFMDLPGGQAQTEEILGRAVEGYLETLFEESFDKGK